VPLSGQVLSYSSRPGSVYRAAGFPPPGLLMASMIVADHSASEYFADRLCFRAASDDRFIRDHSSRSLISYIDHGFFLDPEVAFEHRAVLVLENAFERFNV